MSDQLAMSCRLCGCERLRTVVDLGEMPLANSYLEPSDLELEEPCYPLHARVCEECLLVQLDDAVGADELFSDYAYFSSYSETYLRHAREFAGAAVGELGLNTESLVVEVASNDGYLLRNFVEAGVPCLGIEPAKNVADVARAAGITTETDFFGTRKAHDLVARGLQANLLIANNVLAHVPDLNDFIEGLALVLAPGGVLSVEFPHLMRLVAGVQFDTIYHEHYSYFSLSTVTRALARHDLRVFDVEELPVHGGSLRIWVCHEVDARSSSTTVDRLIERERAAGLEALETYEGFERAVHRCRALFLDFMAALPRQSGTIVAYGAAAKGNTFLNFCGLSRSDIAYAVDRSPHKQGRFLPGSRLPIQPPSRVAETRPDFLLILPWNIREEIMEQMSHVRSWGGRFVTAVPTTEVHE